jgi:hypothetical protein
LGFGSRRVRPAADRENRKRRRNKATCRQNVSSPTIHHKAAAGAVPDKKASLNFSVVRRVMTSNSLFTGYPLQWPIGSELSCMNLSGL